MKRLFIVLCLIFSLALSYGESFSEPSQTVRWLMREPFTIWDWGMYRLKNRLADFRTSEFPIDVRYEFDENKIYISNSPFYAFAQDPTSKQIAKTWCTYLIKEIRTRLVVGADRSKAVCVMSSWFSHEGGFTTRKVPAGLKVTGKLGEALELCDMTEFQLTSRIGEHKFFMCKAPLIGNEIFFAELSREDLIKILFPEGIDKYLGIEKK